MVNMDTTLFRNCSLTSAKSAGLYLLLDVVAFLQIKFMQFKRWYAQCLDKMICPPNSASGGAIRIP